MNKFDHLLKTSRAGAVLLLAIRLYLGWKWLSSGLGKLTGEKPFDATGFLKNAAAHSTGAKPTVPGWWGQFLEHVALPQVKLFNILVPWGEFLVGLALLLGFCTVFAALMGMLMNMSFFLSGSISTIPQMLLCAFLIVYAGSNSGRLGVMYLIYKWRSKAENVQANAT